MIVVQDRSADAFQPVRIRGVWWLPGSNHKIHGELLFKVTSGGTLELDGELAPTFSQVPVIHGENSDQKRITLFNSFICKSTLRGSFTGPASSQTLDVYDMWIGNCWFDSKADVSFQSYSFGIHNLENWADLHCFSPGPSPNPKAITLTYTPPAPILLFENDRLSVSLAANYSGPSFSRGQTESSIRHYPHVHIQSKMGGLPYYGEADSIAECEWMIFVLIALLMGQPTWQFGFKGTVVPLSIKDGFSPEISVRHYCQKDWETPGPFQNPSSDSLLFPYEAIESYLPSIAKTFAELFHKNPSQIETLFRFQCRKKLFEASTLPNLLFAFEKLEDNLFPQQNEPYVQEGKAHATRIQKLLKPYCPKDDWEWVESRLRWQGLAYRKRLNIAFEAMQPLFADLVEPLASDLIAYLSKTRNTYAHEAKATSNDWSRYVHATIWMGDFMTLMLIHACGLPLETIQTIYFRQNGPGHGKTERLFRLFRS